MFTNFSLYPGGAFLMCESVGEYDDNVQLPVPNKTPAEVITPINCEGDDPIVKAIAHLTPVYERSVVPILNLEMAYDEFDAADALAKAETVSTGISDIACHLRKEISKMAGMIRVLNRSDKDIVTEQFAAHIGTFMKNSATVKRQGIETAEYAYHAIPAFSDTWTVRQMLAFIEQNQGVLSEILYEPSLASMMGGYGSRVASTFESTIDLIQCVYTNPERMSRLESKNTCGISFDELMSYQGEGAYENRNEGNIDKMCTQFMRILSSNVRCIAQQCYGLQCHIVEGSLTAQEFTSTIKPLLARCVNVFAFGTIVMMNMATVLRKSAAEKQGVDQYTKLLLDTLKTV